MKSPLFIPALLIPILLEGCSISGPSTQRWEQTGGPYAQEIGTILPDTKAAETLFASIGGGEIAVSTTGGKSWELTAPVPGGNEIRRLVQDPDNSDHLIAATESGAFASTDRARTWTPLGIGPPGTGVRTVTIDPWSTSVMFAGTEGKGMYKSTDAGTSWTEANSGGDIPLSGAEVYDIGIDLARPDLVYAALFPSGVACSTDRGASWKGLTPEFSATGSRVTHLLIKKNGNGALLYGTSSGKIMRSTDWGSSWSPTRMGGDFDEILSLCASPESPDSVLAGTDRGIIVSSDFGQTWKPGRGGLPAIPTRVAAAAGPHGTLYAYGSGMGLRASDDQGESWRGAAITLGGSSVSMLASDPAGDRLFAATGSVCMTYTAGPPGAWSDAGPGITGGAVRWISVDPAEPGRLYAATSGGVFISTDNGGSWKSTPRSMQISPFLYEAHPSIHTRMFMASDQGIFVSTDRGRSWNQARPLGNTWAVRSLTFSPTNAGTIIGATSNSGVVISYDGGFTWEQARYGIPGDRVESVTLDDANADTYYAYLADGACYRTLNKGLEWNRYLPPWKSSGHVRIAADPRTPSSVVALVDNRYVYYSPSGGGTWFRAADADLGAEALALCWNAGTMTLYAGSRDKGVLMLSLAPKIRSLLGE